MRFGILLGVLLAGCGAPSPAPAAPASAPPALAAPTEPDPYAPLAPDDAFADLVAIARGRADEVGRAPGDGCLLGREGAHALALRGDVSLALRPLPDPPEALAEALAGAPHVAGVLSLFGLEGRGPLLLAAFTPMPAPSEAGAIVVVLTSRGAHVRGTREGARGADRLGGEALEAEVRTRAEAGASPIVLAAEAPVPLGAIEETLAVLARTGAPVTLAVPLAPGTDPPRALAADATRGDAPRCAGEGLGGPPDAATVRAALAGFDAEVRACRRSTSSADAARGGVVRLRIEADASGRVRAACAASDAVHDPTLLRCLEASAMDLALPATPSGFAADLPIRYARDATFDRAPLCAPGPAPSRY